MQCVILAGGLGTRVKTLTGQLPKALLQFQGKPFIHYQLQWLKRFGIQEVVLSIGYEGSQIRDYVGKGAPWNLNIKYLDEGNQLRGTGGAVRFALDQGVLDPIFFLMYGDSFLPIDFRAIWAYFYNRNDSALMTVLRNKGQWDKSNALFDGMRVTLYDKHKAGDPSMEYIDYGLSLLRRERLTNSLSTTVPSDLADYFHGLSIHSELAGYEVHQRFYEVGSLKGIADFESYLAQHPNDFR